MATVTSSRLHALSLCLWGLVLLRAGSDGRLELLLRGAFHPLVNVAGLLLLLWAAMQLLTRQRRSLQSTPADGRDWRTAFATTWIALLLISLPPNPSFADLAQRRPVDDSSESALAFVLPPAQRSLTDWVRLLRSQGDPRLYAGDPVHISGFVLPTAGGPPQLARLLVRCCLADATPVGLPVRWPPGRAWPKGDQWLQISGTMAVQSGPQGEELVVVPQRITPIERPARPLEP